MNFSDFLESISKIKNIPLPGEVSQFKMVPPFRQELVRQQKYVIKNAKRAGVLALFYPDEFHKTKFVLILRNTYKGVHSAQVAFPGGKLEARDTSLKDAAVRETFEEIGVPIKDIEVLQELTQVYIPPSNFYVQPFIGMVQNTPNFVKEENEVETLIEVDLKYFLEEERVITNTVTTSYSVDVEVPAFNLNDYVVWGATAMILSEIKDLLKQML